MFHTCKGLRLNTLLACLVLAACQMLILGCGRDEPAKTPDQSDSKVSRSSGTPEGSLTRPLLALMPDDAAAAMATPSLSGPYLTAMTLWERTQADPAAFRASIRESAREWAAAWGVQGEMNDHLDALRAVGIDVDAPAALFVDAESFERHMVAGDAPAAAPSSDEELPRGVAIVHCSDAERAEHELAKLAERLFGTSVAPEAVEVGGITLTRLSPAPCWYFFEDNRLILGTNPELTAAVLRKRDNPNPVRYGTPECPADSDNEIVVLAKMAKLEELQGALGADGYDAGPVAGLVLGQILPWKAGDGADISDDPLVATLALEENRIALRARIDVEEHPGLLRSWGAPPRIDYLGLMPDSTKGTLSLGLTPEWKSLLLEGIRKSNPDEPTAGAIAETLLGALGDEITVAVTGTRDDLPVMAIMVDVTQPDLFKGLLGLSGSKLVPLDPGASDGIMKLESPMQLPTPVFADLGENHLFVANDAELLRQIHAIQGSAATPVFLDGFMPPVDPSTPRYSLLLVGESGISDVLAQLLLDPAERNPFSPALAMVRDVRAAQELEGTWQTTYVDVHLN